MARILIIGGTGNISTPIVRQLIERGDEVTVLNRGSRPVDGARNIAADRKDGPAFREAVRGAGAFECVMDMIGYEPEDARQLIECFSGRTEQLIFCSTVDVFQKPAPGYPIREDAPRLQDPAFAYAHKKGIQEEMLEEAAGGGAFQLTILRPAATYNDAWAPIGILSGGLAVMRRLREGKKVIVLGDGTSLWTSTHRDDVARAFCRAVLNPKTYGRGYTVCGPEALAWDSYYQTVAEALGAPAPRFVHIPSRILAQAEPEACGWCLLNFMYSNIFDNADAVRDLDFRYTIPWTDGARRMAEHGNRTGGIDAAADHPRYERVIELYERLARQLAEA
jgi:nucleoside-diphosphate-sugar epimerase